MSDTNPDEVVGQELIYYYKPGGDHGSKCTFTITCNGFEAPTVGTYDCNSCYYTQETPDCPDIYDPITGDYLGVRRSC